MKEKNKLDFIKIKTFVYQRHYQESEKTTQRMGENMSDHMSDQGLASRIYKKFKNKKTNNPIQRPAKDLNRYLSKVETAHLSSSDDWINPMWYIVNIIQPSATKRNEVLINEH